MSIIYRKTDNGYGDNRFTKKHISFSKTKRARKIASKSRMFNLKRGR